MTKTTTTYTLPPEPDGPVWDSHGKRWTPTDIDGWWLRDVTGVQCTWARVLEGYGPLTSTPPWKPEVGGIVKTEEQYAAMPEGSVVVKDGTVPTYYKRRDGLWCATWQTDRFADMKMAGTSRTILRVGRES